MALPDNILQSLRSLQKEVLLTVKDTLELGKTSLQTIKTQKQAAMTYMNVPLQAARVKKDLATNAYEAAQTAASVVPRDIISAIPPLGILNDVAQTKLEDLSHLVDECTKEYNSLSALVKREQAEVGKLDAMIADIDKAIAAIDEVLSNPA